MSIIKENQDNLETALANLENVVEDARVANRRVSQNLAFVDDLTVEQQNRRLAKIDPFAVEIQKAFNATKVAFQATEPIVEG